MFKMDNIQWMTKLYLAAAGTIASVVLDNITTIGSVIASVLTIIYLIYNIKLTKTKLNGAVESNKYNKFIRRNDIKKMMEEEKDAESGKEYN